MKHILWILSTVWVCLISTPAASTESHTKLKVTDVNQTSSSVELTTLKTLPVHQISTRTPWEEGLHTYTGFNPNDLLNALDIKGHILRLYAFNHYITEIPLSDFNSQTAIIAYEKDGRPISVRNKGPLMVIYNFDGNEELRNERYYSRAIWQIEAIEVRTTGEP